MKTIKIRDPPFCFGILGAGVCPAMASVKGGLVAWPGHNGGLVFSNSASSEHSLRVNQTVHVWAHSSIWGAESVLRPPAKTELVSFYIETRCADTVPFQPKPTTPF